MESSKPSCENCKWHADDVLEYCPGQEGICHEWCMCIDLEQAKGEGMARKVDLDLYEFLKKQEVHLEEKNGEITMYALIRLWDLEEFQRIIDAEIYCDEGLEVVMMHDYIVTPLNELLEYREEYISSYLDCVNDAAEVEMYRSELEYE